MKKIYINAAKVKFQMTKAELQQYKIELVPETDTPTDHELLLEVLKEIKDIKYDVAILKSDVKSINNRIDNLVIKNNLLE